MVGRLICFEGIDGSGKTTTANALAERLLKSGREVVALEKKNAPFPTQFLQDHMQKVKAALWDYPKDGPIHELGDHHWLFLMAAWFSAMDVSVIRPAVTRGAIVVVDNWFYKFLLRFSFKEGFDRVYLESLFSHLTVPDRVFLLNPEPRVARNRRGIFTPTESGALDGFGADALDEYQLLTQRKYVSLGEELGWLMIDNSAMSLPAVVDRVCNDPAIGLYTE